MPSTKVEVDCKAALGHVVRTVDTYESAKNEFDQFPDFICIELHGMVTHYIVWLYLVVYLGNASGEQKKANTLRAFMHPDDRWRVKEKGLFKGLAQECRGCE